MNVLGLNCHAHDSSAALICDGELVFAAEEERFSRIKKDRSFPKQSIYAALEYGGISFDDIDAVAFGWNRPGVGPLHTIARSILGQLPRSPGWTIEQLFHIGAELRIKGGLQPLIETFGPLKSQRLMYVDHHDSHAWSTYAVSGFEEALVIVMDGWGSWQSTSIYVGRGPKLERLRVFPYPNSIGVFYEGFTDLLGFERNNDEWKVMGLAAYGQPTVPLGDALRVIPGGYKLNAKLMAGRKYGDISALVQKFGPRRKPDVHISDEDKDLAASVQRATEESIFAVVREGIRLTGLHNVCLAGGVAMNSKANGRLLESGLVEEIFVQPAATDDGAAIGAGLAASERLGVAITTHRMEDVYLGPEFSEEDVERSLNSFGLQSFHVPNIEETTARLLAEGNIVGWFQGRMEFGPRALGNRSILADARRLDMRDRVNDSVKYREIWRPFAPSCLEEAAGEYFEGCTEAPFMILTFNVRPEKRDVIPAVTHADNTARVQTVRHDVNPRYWQLINEFAKLTGVPVLLNTSFNLKGEPIVCTPKDAIRTFFSSGLNFLVMNNFVIPKDPSWRPELVEEAADSRRR